MAPSATSDAASDTRVVLPGVQERILDATLRCIGRGGVGKLTLDEVAREAGCGRATVYRTFPSGKDGVMEAAAAHETSRFFAAVEPALAAADDLEDLLVAGISGAARFATASEALVHLAVHEPGLILTHVAFDRVDVVFAAAERFLGPHLARFLPAHEVANASEWVTRVTLLYLCLPYAPLDLTDEVAARRLVRTHLLPGLVPTPPPNVSLQPRS